MLSGQDIGWLQEVLDNVPGVTDESECAALTVSTPGRQAVIIIPEREGGLQEDNWLPEHDYYFADGQPVLEDEADQIAVTAAFFMDETGLSPKDPKFEFHFRAFIHNMDYSYNPNTIGETIRNLKGA